MTAQASTAIELVDRDRGDAPAPRNLCGRECAAAQPFDHAVAQESR
jgi:hypothetical protein